MPKGMKQVPVFTCLPGTVSYAALAWCNTLYSNIANIDRSAGIGKVNTVTTVFYKETGWYGKFDLISPRFMSYCHSLGSASTRRNWRKTNLRKIHVLAFDYPLFVWGGNRRRAY